MDKGVQKWLFPALVSAVILLAGVGLAALLLKGKNTAGSASAGLSAEEAGPEETGLYWRVVEENEQTLILDGEENRAPLVQYRRMVVLSPGAVEVLYMIGAESAVAGISSGREQIWPAEKTALLPTVGNTARPSLESIVAMEPDLIIGNAMNAALMEDLSSRSYTVLIHNADSLADIFNSTILLGRITGKTAEAQALVAEKQAQMDSLKAELNNNPLKLKGAFLYSANPIMAFTSRSLAGEILTILGVENIAAGLDAAQPILSPEYILGENPDFLFGAMSITKPEDILAADSVIAQTRAGMEGNIKIVPSSLFLRTSPRIVESLLELYDEIKNYAPR
jgi:iron complex transport system substrate-binding protein